MNLRYKILQMLAPKPVTAAFKVPGACLIGDSIMFGGVGDGLRKAIPGVVIHDRSVPGDTAYQAAIRFPWELRSTETVVLECGTNDLNTQRNPVPYLRDMALFALAEDRRVIFTGILQREDIWVDSVNREIRDLASELGCLHAQWDSIMHPKLADGLHPEPVTVDHMVTLLTNTIGYLPH